MRIFLIAIYIFLLLPFNLSANTVVRSGETVAIADDQVIEGDFYGFGNTVAISGKATEDLFLLGGNVTINGEVGGDLAIVGGMVDVHGTVDDDVRIVGGTVVIAGDIPGNLVVVASDLKILSTATIGGDLLFYGRTADISGTLEGNILGTSEKIRVDGKVGGVDIRTGSLVLGSRADVANNVSYTSAHELVRAQEAKVAGKIIYSDNVPLQNNSARGVVVVFLIFLFSTLVANLFLKEFSLKVTHNLEGRTLRYLGIGFGVTFLTPIAGVILMVSTLGSIIGFMLFSLYFVLICLTFALLGVVAGSYIRRLNKSSNDLSVLYIVLGVLFVNLLFYVPLVGPVLLVGLITLTLGVITEKIIQSIRSQ